MHTINQNINLSKSLCPKLGTFLWRKMSKASAFEDCVEFVGVILSNTSEVDMFCKLVSQRRLIKYMAVWTASQQKAGETLRSNRIVRVVSKMSIFSFYNSVQLWSTRTWCLMDNTFITKIEDRSIGLVLSPRIKNELLVRLLEWVQTNW